jgi:uncharacterized phage protein (TIGR01671 family)
MAREIKFRAWVPAEVNAAIGYMQDNPPMWYTDGEYINDTFSDGRIYMQFTGLLDRNGTEVYESDVISYLDDSGFKHTEEAVWSQRLVGFAPFAEQQDGDDMSTFFIRDDTVEVLGNRYEHPNLLQENPNTTEEES